MQVANLPPQVQTSKLLHSQELPKTFLVELLRENIHSQESRTETGKEHWGN